MRSVQWSQTAVAAVGVGWYGGLTLTGSQMLTQPHVHPHLNSIRGKTKMKKLVDYDKDMEVHLHSHGQNSHELEKINLLPIKIQLDGDNQRKYFL